MCVVIDNNNFHRLYFKERYISYSNDKNFSLKSFTIMDILCELLTNRDKVNFVTQILLHCQASICYTDSRLNVHVYQLERACEHIRNSKILQSYYSTYYSDYMNFIQIFDLHKNDFYRKKMQIYIALYRSMIIDDLINIVYEYSLLDYCPIQILKTSNPVDVLKINELQVAEIVAFSRQIQLARILTNWTPCMYSN